jgi:hypothetical protein
MTQEEPRIQEVRKGSSKFGKWGPTSLNASGIIRPDRYRAVPRGRQEAHLPKQRRAGGDCVQM